MTAETDLLPLPGKQARPHDELICELLDSRLPKTELEHAAAREIERLRAEVDALAKDAAKYRWGINNARWVRSEQEAYVAIPVAPDADLSCVAMRDAAIDAAMQRTSGGDHG